MCLSQLQCYPQHHFFSDFLCVLTFHDNSVLTLNSGSVTYFPHCLAGLVLVYTSWPEQVKFRLKVCFVLKCCVLRHMVAKKRSWTQARSSPDHKTHCLHACAGLQQTPRANFHVISTKKPVCV